MLGNLECLDRQSAEQKALNIATHVLEHLRQVHIVDAMELHISASIGVKIFPDNNQDADSVIAQADSGMYEAKKHGKNQIQVI